jgi:hypothetical protein
MKIKEITLYFLSLIKMNFKWLEVAIMRSKPMELEE